MADTIKEVLYMYSDYIECDEYHIHDGSGEHEGDTPYEKHKEFNDDKAIALRMLHTHQKMYQVSQVITSAVMGLVHIMPGFGQLRANP